MMGGTDFNWGMLMSYVDAVVIAVPTAKKDAYLDLAERYDAIIKSYGALKVTECWGDDVPDGKLTSLPKAVMLEDGETVVFSWIIWPDKATRDAGWAKMHEDPRMAELGDMPFDGKRMIFGGFTPILEV